MKTFCLLALAAVATASHADEIVLRKSDGAAIAVQTNGPLADERAVTLARDISGFDSASRTRDAFSTVDDAALRQALTALAAALRDDAVDQLDLAYRVARRTSAGLDDRLLAPGFASMKKLSELVSRPPARLFVSTQITTATVGATLWFMGRGDYKKGLDAWEGYTPGRPMKIGIYEFRATGPGDARPRCQSVEIMIDPLVATLDPGDCR